MDLLQRESERSGFWAIVPIKLAVCVGIGCAVGYFVPSDFWSDGRWDISTAVYGGLLTFSGLILALGWSAFSRIYETLFRGDFGAYLYEKNLLNDYLVHISFMHVAQVLSVVFCGVGLVSVLFDSVWSWLDRSIMAAVVAAIVYGLKQSLDAVTMMNDLAWNAAIFERHKNNQRDAPNVVKAFGGK
jgi:hypothetical protein